MIQTTNAKRKHSIAKSQARGLRSLHIRAPSHQIRVPSSRLNHRILNGRVPVEALRNGQNDSGRKRLVCFPTLSAEGNGKDGARRSTIPPGSRKVGSCQHRCSRVARRALRGSGGEVPFPTERARFPQACCLVFLLRGWYSQEV